MTLGVVVVGVGIAGRVRIRDIGQAQQFEETKDVQLIGFVSRRQLDIDGVQQLTLEEALSRKDVHIIIICTENATHEEFARKALEAKKNVLVEFPLAKSHDGARELMELGLKQGVLCYEEDIGLMTEEHGLIKEAVQEKTLKEGFTHLKGKFNGWIENIEESGSPFTTGISRIHAQIDLFGDLTPVEAWIQKEDKRFRSHAKLHTKNNKPVIIEMDRKDDPEWKRSKTFGYTFEDGTVLDAAPVDKSKKGPPAEGPQIGLFMKDFIQFVQLLRDGVKEAPNKWLTLRSLQICDELFQMAKQSAQSTGLV